MYDAAVLGVGSMGAFAALELARRGLRVVGIDRFVPPHTHGSHSGETRVYREAYAEHPDYVPLAVLAGRLWEQHGAAAGRTLLTRCGQLSLGRPESELVAGIRHSAEVHGVAVESLSHADVLRRYPMLRIGEDEVGMLEPGAGWVDVNAALEVALAATRASGGELRLGTAVDGWDADADGVTLWLAGGDRVRARRLVVCAGAWSSEMLPAHLLPGGTLPLRVVRKVLVWARPRQEFAAVAGRLPVLSFARKVLYTFPARDGLFKMAVHWTDKETRTDPENVAAPGESDLPEVINEAVRHLGPMFGDETELRERIAVTKTCLYTMTPDEHFVLDRVGGAPVWFGAGFSGHGFKFAPAIGRVLAEMCLGEATSAPVEFLAAARFRPSSALEQPLHA